MKSISKISLFLLILFMIAIYSGLGSARLLASESKDVILVLDTSLSMAGFGGKDIINDVKISIEKFIDKLEDGDRVTFMTFDTDVKIYPEVLVDDVNDRDILKKYISMTEAKGEWTHTLIMIQGVFEKADELAKDEEDRQTLIVIMTDGLDDPPPNKRKDKFSLTEITNKYQGKDWWIYFVSFSDLQKNTRLKEELGRVTEHSTIIDAADDPQKGIETDLTEDLRRREAEAGSGGIIILIVVIILVIAIAAGLFFYKRLSDLKIAGLLEYWNNDILDPYLEKFDFSKYKLKEISIGKGAGCKLNIRDINIPSPFKIIAVREKGDVKLKIQSGEGYSIEFKNREPGPILKDGDIFQVENYSFKYMDT